MASPVLARTQSRQPDKTNVTTVEGGDQIARAIGAMIALAIVLLFFFPSLRPTR